MKTTEKRSPLIKAISELKEVEAIKIVKKRLSLNHDPMVLIDECQVGMRIVGQYYQNRNYFISGLIMGGEIFREVMELISPAIEKQTYESITGKVLLGTVEGDIHNLGKDIVKTLLICHKFDVYDLGTDIPPDEFVKKAEVFQPDIIGLSGLISVAYDSMKETVNRLHLKGLRTPVIIGGSQLNKDVWHYTGADFWVNEARKGVDICCQLLYKKKEDKPDLAKETR
jgi:methanogenic corrinoid protein MtbC1